MVEQELIKDINDELTFSGALPFSLNEKEIGRILTIAREFFYDNWRHSVEPKYMVLPLEMFRTEYFRKHRQIQLPDCIRMVTECKEIKGGSVFATIDRDFSEQKFVGSEIFLTPFMGESIMYRTAVFSFLDLTKNLVLDTMAFDYNKNTRLLAIKGRTPLVNVVIDTYKTIEPEALYNDELYQRYVRAKAKLRLNEMLEAFEFELPGGVKLRYDRMMTKAETEMAKVEEMFVGENTPDFMFLERW